MNEKIMTREIRLERLRVGLEKRISKYLLEKEHQPTFEMVIREMAEEISICFHKSYLAKQQNEKIYFQFPKTWKDHFKLRYRKNWLIKKWVKKYPIQFVKHEYDIKKMIVFPDYKIPYGKDFENYFVIFQTEKRK